MAASRPQFTSGISEHNSAQMTGKAKRAVKVALSLIAFALLVLTFWLGPVLRAFWKGGFLDPAVTRKYQGTSLENLRALHQAMMLYHDSEERFPESSGWMDAIKNYLKTADLSEEDAMKKLVNPLIRPPSKTVFGYSMNDAMGAKFKGDIKDPSRAILLFDGLKTGWNAHGNPARDEARPPRPGGNRCITVDGRIRVME